GCVALRPLSVSDAEMKRLYVRPPYRGKGLGRLLALRAIQDARALGYSTLKLDTLPSMAAAQAMYESLGFVDAQRYTENPVGGGGLIGAVLSGEHALCGGRNGEGILVPLERAEALEAVAEPFSGERRIVDVDRHPAYLLHGVARDLPAERAREHLPAEAVAD